MLTDIIAERFLKKLGTESFNERISIVEKYKKQWELSEIEFKSEFSINSLIFDAVSKRYGKVILKILIDYHGFDNEIMALKLFQGEHFCKLYEYSLDDKVYLMERIVPAHTLYESAPRNERMKIAGEIFKGLHKTDLPDSTFPTYTEWFEAGKKGTKNREDCEELYQYLDSAERMLTDICKKYSRNLLLHGDLHHENILKNENRGYTVIDPKGVIGDPVFDLSRFILDEFRDDLTSEPKDVVIDFVQKLGDGAGIPCEILLRCLYIETVIWLFREELANGESLEECQQLITNMKVAYEFAHSRKYIEQSDKKEFDKEKNMDFPLTLYYDAEVTNVEIKDSSHGDSDFRKAYIVNDGASKIVIKYFSNSFSNKRRIMGWFRLMDEYRKIGLYCPAIIPNRHGELLYRHTVDGRDYYVYAEEFSAFQTAEQLDVEKKQYMPDVLRSLGTIASKRLDFLDFPSAYCLLEPFASVDTTDEETECALLFVDYIKKNLPQHLPRAEKLLDLFYKNQEECRKVYASLPTSCFQADLNSSNILLDDNLKFVGLFDFNLCGKEKILNYAMREALWATYQDCLVDKDKNYIFYFDKKLDDIRMKSFLENMSYIQQTYAFSDDEKKAFPILLRYINTFWWYSLSDLECFGQDDSKVEKILDWFELQMTRNDIMLV